MGRYLKVGDITLDMHMFTAKRSDKDVDLTPAEFKLLAYFMMNADKVLSKEQILKDLWESELTENYVEVYVKYLRQKLGSDAIKTRRGFGYYVTSK